MRGLGKRVVRLDEQVARRGGMPVAQIRDLPSVEFNPDRAAADVAAAAAAAAAAATAAEAAAAAAAVGEDVRDGGDSGDGSDGAANRTPPPIPASAEAEVAAAVLAAADMEEVAAEAAAEARMPYAGHMGEDCAICLVDFEAGAYTRPLFSST